MKSKFILAVAFVALTACKQEPAQAPKTETAQALQTAAQVEAPKATAGAEFMGMEAQAKADLLKQGDVERTRSLLTFEFFGAANALREGSLESFSVGDRTHDKPLILGLRQARILTVRAAGGPTECDAACQNTHVNKAFEPLIGGVLYKEDGSLNAATLKTLADKLWAGPEDKTLTLSNALIYQAFKPSVREYALVFKALRAMDQAALRTEFDTELKASASDPRAMVTFYKRFANMNDLAGATGLEKSSRLAIAAGFWMRRMADGTLPVMEETLKRTLMAYDKPLHDEVFAAQ